MIRKPRSRPEAFSSDETFHYHLTELELVVASGKVTWTADSANAAHVRLIKVAAMIGPSAPVHERG
jgi:hypothetical protein